jgi:D-alanine-D-alanine ligase
MAEKKRLRVGVLFGGRSGEHEISLRSALTVMSAMDPAQYEVVPIGIGRDGRWYLERNALKLLAEKTPHLAALSAGGTQVTLLPHPEGQALVATPADGAHGESTGAQDSIPGVDVVFPVLHGTYGEDGTVQGLFELAGIAYVGAGVLGSAVGMDKDAQKRLLRDAGVAVVKYFAIDRVDYVESPEIGAKLARKLGYPVFVKPNALGSSIGISRVKRAADLKAALDDAFQYDRKALIEASCEGREFECAVLGNDRPKRRSPARCWSRARTSSTTTSRSTSIRKAPRPGFPPRCRPPRRRSCARWRWRRSGRCRCAAWPASISWRAAICARSTSTK